MAFDVYNDFKLIGELYRLCDRYDVSRLRDRIIDGLTDSNQLIEPNCVSEEYFNKKWLKIKSIARIAFESQITRLTDNVMTFIDINFDHFLNKDNKEMRELNDLTDGRLFELKANKKRKLVEEMKRLEEKTKTLWKRIKMLEEFKSAKNGHVDSL